jgi:hypothetical protein
METGSEEGWKAGKRHLSCASREIQLQRFIAASPDVERVPLSGTMERAPHKGGKFGFFFILLLEVLAESQPGGRHFFAGGVSHWTRVQ